MMMKLVGAFAEFEYAMIPERTSGGLALSGFLGTEDSSAHGAALRYHRADRVTHRLQHGIGLSKP
jgi:hypothetical protein